MRVLSMNIKDFKSIKDATIPMYRELNQVYSDDKGCSWDLMVCSDILFRAIKKGWTSLSNVCTERMNGDSELSAMFIDEDDYVRKETGELVPVIYKAVMKKARPESWCTDVDIRYYYSNSGDEGPWTETTNHLILRKIKRVCDDIIMDAEENASLIRMNKWTIDTISFTRDRQKLADFSIMLPWMMLSNDSMMGKTIIIEGAYRFTRTRWIADFFKSYLRCNKDEKHIVIYVEKRTHLDMKTRATIIHNGISYEYDIKAHDNEWEREKFYKKELRRILSIKKKEE